MTPEILEHKAGFNISFDTKPNAGEVLIGFARTINSGFTWDDLTVPEGFVKHNIYRATGAYATIYLFYKVAVLDEPNSYQFSHPSNDKGMYLFRVKNVDVTNIFVGRHTNNSSASGAPYTLGIGPIETHDDALVMSGFSFQGSTSNITASNGFSIVRGASEFVIIHKALSDGDSDSSSLLSSPNQPHNNRRAALTVGIVGQQGAIIAPDQEDYAATQYSLKRFVKTGWSNAVQSVKIDSTSAQFTDNGNTVDVRIPGNLATGTYIVEMENTQGELANSSLFVTQTHTIPAPIGNVHASSILAGQVPTPTNYPEGSYIRVGENFVSVEDESVTFAPIFVTADQGFTSTNLTMNLAEVIKAPAGTTGTFVTDISVLRPDGVVMDSTLTVNVQTPQ